MIRISSGRFRSMVCQSFYLVVVIGKSKEILDENCQAGGTVAKRKRITFRLIVTILTAIVGGEKCI